MKPWAEYYISKVKDPVVRENLDAFYQRNVGKLPIGEFGESSWSRAIHHISTYENSYRPRGKEPNPSWKPIIDVWESWLRSGNSNTKGSQVGNHLVDIKRSLPLIQLRTKN
jgi:hypothetical protein